jgi:hypothetical protein
MASAIGANTPHGNRTDEQRNHRSESGTHCHVWMSFHKLDQFDDDYFSDADRYIQNKYYFANKLSEPNSHFRRQATLGKPDVKVAAAHGIGFGLQKGDFEFSPCLGHR